MKGTIRNIIKYSLHEMRMHSEDAEELIFKTGMAETGYRHLRQVSGPALGFFQCEPATIKDTWENYAVYRPEVKVRLWELGYKEDADDLAFIGNIPVQVAFCRLKYRRDKHPLPPKDDIQAQAEYWKRVYNTELGKGTVKHFIEANNG